MCSNFRLSSLFDWINHQLRADNQLNSDNVWWKWTRDNPKTNPESYHEGIWTRCICLQIPSPRFWTTPMTPCKFFTHVFQKRIYNCRAFLVSSEYGKLKNNECHSELNYAKAALPQLWNGEYETNTNLVFLQSPIERFSNDCRKT